MKEEWQIQFWVDWLHDEYGLKRVDMVAGLPMLNDISNPKMRKRDIAMILNSFFEDLAEHVRWECNNDGKKD